MTYLVTPDQITLKAASVHPYPIQNMFELGRAAFKKNDLYRKITLTGLNEDQHREWLRGWNFAYFQALRRAKSIERNVREKEKNK